MLPPSDEYIRFYHPRKDNWREHFEIDGSLILPKTRIAEATIKILKFNDTDRLIERQIWLSANMYPHPAASFLFE